MDTKAPVFVKFDAYKDIMDITSLMREKIKQAKFLLDRIADLKAQEDAQLASWTKELESVESSIASIDRSLSQ